NAILVTSVVAVFITTSEAFAEVVIVVALAYVITAIAEVRIFISERGTIIESPAIFAVSPSGSEAFLIAIPNCLTQSIGSIVVHVVVPATAIVSIIRRSVEVWIVIVVVAAVILQPQLLLL